MDTLSLYALRGGSGGGGGNLIDDTTISTTKTWSSSKLNEDLVSKLDVVSELPSVGEHNTEMITDANYIAKKTSATANHIATFSSDGDIKDSEKTLSQFIEYTDTSAMKNMMNNVVEAATPSVMLKFWGDVPQSQSSSGYKGDIACDSNYLYICTSNNSWKKITLADVE